MRSHFYGRTSGFPAGVHRLGWGIIAVALYLGTVIAAGPLPGPILYDGFVPLPPYRWVHPPAERARDNQPPTSQVEMLPIGPQGSRAAEVFTPDDQALVTFPEGVIGPRAGEASVKVTITPLDAASVAPAPRGQPFDGNGYRIDASYAASAVPVVLVAPVTVVLRYAVHATQMLRNQDREWVTLSTTRFDGSQQVIANTDRLGVFAAAGARGLRGTRDRSGLAPFGRPEGRLNWSMSGVIMEMR